MSYIRLAFGCPEFTIHWDHRLDLRIQYTSIVHYSGLIHMHRVVLLDHLQMTSLYGDVLMRNSYVKIKERVIGDEYHASCGGFLNFRIAHLWSMHLHGGIESVCSMYIQCCKPSRIQNSSESVPCMLSWLEEYKIAVEKRHHDSITTLVVGRVVDMNSLGSHYSRILARERN